MAQLAGDTGLTHSPFAAAQERLQAAQAAPSHAAAAQRWAGQWRPHEVADCLEAECSSDVRARAGLRASLLVPGVAEAAGGDGSCSLSHRRHGKRATALKFTSPS